MKGTDLVIVSRAKGPRSKGFSLKRIPVQDLDPGSLPPRSTVILVDESKLWAKESLLATEMKIRLQRATKCIGSLNPELSFLVFPVSLGVSLEGQLKDFLDSLKARTQHARPSALDAIAKETHATVDLRTDSGRLSAKRVADLYGLSLKELAELLGRSRQAVGKTPDAEALQKPLDFFERIARLRTVLKQGAAAFRRWLNMPNRQLEGESPLDWIKQRRWQDVADLVDDILTGAPS